MLTDGIDLVEGSDINNAVIESGGTLPGIAVDGQLYYLTTGNIGLHVFDQGNWTLLGDSGSLTTHIANDVAHLTTIQNDLLDSIVVDSTELNNITGATSNIQTQLDAILGNSVAGDVGDLISFDGSNNLQDAGITAGELKTGRKNKIINGGFDIWQRGTSFTEEGYTADRWKMGFSDGFTTDSAIDIEFFEMLGDNYVSIATEDASGSGIGSRVYKFNTSTNTFEFFQEVTDKFCQHSTYFEIAGEHYLFFSVVVDGGSHVTNSKLFKYSVPNVQFEFYQDVPTQGSGGSDFITIGANHYLMVANQSNGVTNNINSFLYKWNFGTELFDLHQQIFAFGAENVRFFEMLGDVYLAIAEPSNFPITNIVDQQILKYNSGTDQLEAFQLMTAIVGGTDWEHFEIAGDHYIVTAEVGNGNVISFTSRIFKFNVGTQQFELFQTMPTSGASGWQFFTIGSDNYLIVANSTTAVGIGPQNQVNSEIFKFNVGTQQFDSYQSIPTFFAQDWDHATIGGDDYLIVANRHSGTSFIADSKLYKFNTSTNFFEEESVVNPSLIRQTAGGTSPLESKYFVDLTSDISTGSIGIEQRIEDVLQFNGETMTISFYARCDVNSTLIVNLNRVGLLGETEPSDISLSQPVLVTPTWEKHNFTFSWSHLSNGINPANYLSVGFVSDASIVSSTFIADIQLEEGTIATSLEYRHPEIELNLCQRYFNKSYDLEVEPNTITNDGICEHKIIAGFSSSNTLTYAINYPTGMRTTPSLVVISNVTGVSGVVCVDGVDRALDSANVGNNVSTITVTNPSSTSNRHIQFHYTADAEL